MTEIPGISAAIPKPEPRTGTLYLFSWLVLLVGITGFSLWLALAGHAMPGTVAASQVSPPLEVGALAPDFALRDHEGKTHHLQDALKNGPVLLIFYLNLSCQHCAAQLQAVGGAQERLSRRQVTIFGISGDSPQFTKESLADFGGVPYPLLADEGHHVATSYGVYTGGDKPITLHGLFLIGQDRRIRFMETGEEAYMDVEEIENQAAKAGAATRP